MKILVVSHHLPPKYRAGAELYALRQALWLKAKGHTVATVAVEEIEAELPKLEVRSEPYQGLEVNRLYFNRLSYPNPLEASHLNPEITAWMERYLQEFQPDLMLVNACYLLGVGILHAARKLDIPVVVTLHDFWFLCQRITLMQPDGALCDGKVSAADCALCLNKDARRYLWADKLTGGLAGKLLVAGSKAGFSPAINALGGQVRLETLNLRRQRLFEALQEVQAIIAPSRYLKQVFVENGFPEDKIYYCRYGLDTEHLSSIEAKRAKQQPAHANRKNTGSLRVGYLGQVLPHKGVDILVEAFRQLDAPEIRLSIHGVMGRDPKYDQKLYQLAGKDPRISFIGPYTPDQLPGILLGLDAVVVPSIWLENSPLIIMEAQAAGLPVVTTNLGGMAEMVQHEHNGLLFERKNVLDLARQLQRLISEPALLPELRQNITSVKSLDQEFSELLPIYERVTTKTLHYSKPD